MSNLKHCGACATTRGLLPLGFLVCAGIISQLPLTAAWHQGAAYLAAFAIALMAVSTIYRLSHLR